MSAPLPPASATPSDSLVTTTHVVYALHTLGLVIGAFGTASVMARSCSAGRRSSPSSSTT